MPGRDGPDPRTHGDLPVERPAGDGDSAAVNGGPGAGNDDRGAVVEGRSAVAGILRSGLLAATLHPLSSWITVLALVAMLAPFLLAEGISRGLSDQAHDAVAGGADVYVGAERFGLPAPVPRSAAALLREIPGVTGVELRVVAQAHLGREAHPVLWVGVPDERLPAGAALVEGRMWRPGARNELVVGSELARRLAITVGSVIPPFYRNDEGERLSTVVGVFRADLPVWQAHAVVSSIETASHVFAERGAVTSILVTCPDTYRDAVRRKVLEIPSLAPDGEPPLRPRVVTRDEMRALVESRILVREGAFALHMVLAFAIGVPLLLATTGLGLAERRRETGLLKALGWRTDEVVLRSLFESLALAAAGTAGAVLVVWAWVRWLGAAGIARLFLPDADLAPGFDVPFRLLPAPLVAGVAVAVVVTSAGTLLSSWRAASAPPAEAVR